MVGLEHRDGVPLAATRRKTNPTGPKALRSPSDVIDAGERAIQLQERYARWFIEVDDGWDAEVDRATILASNKHPRLAPSPMRGDRIVGSHRCRIGRFQLGGFGGPERVLSAST